MDKNLAISNLLDYYGGLLTDKQRDVVELYYNEDLSLAEISEHEGITRQGVRDSIKRGEAFLLELEEKLGMAKTFGDLYRLLDQIRAITDEADRHNREGAYSADVDADLGRIRSLIDSYNELLS